MRSQSLDDVFVLLAAVQWSAADLARLREWIAFMLAESARFVAPKSH